MDNITGFHVTHGYCRCSTDESKQDINRQIRELKKYGATRIWTEFEHGDAAVKEQQQTMLQAAQPGDTVVVLEVSRLARSTRQLCEVMETIRDRHLCLRIVGSITMDCRAGTPDPMAEAFLQIAGVFGQLALRTVGTCHDPQQGEVWHGQRTGERSPAGSPAYLRRWSAGAIFAVLSPVFEGGRQRVRTGTANRVLQAHCVPLSQGVRRRVMFFRHRRQPRFCYKSNSAYDSVSVDFWGSFRSYLVIFQLNITRLFACKICFYSAESTRSERISLKTCLQAL